MLRCNFDSKASTMRKKATVNRQLIKARTRAEEGEIKREERRGRNEGEEEEKEGEKKVERVGTRSHDLEGRGRVQARLKLPLCLTDLETARFAIAPSAPTHHPAHPPSAAQRTVLLAGNHSRPTWNFANGISPFTGELTRNPSNRCPTDSIPRVSFFLFLDSLPAMNRFATWDGTLFSRVSLLLFPSICFERKI